MTLTAVARAKEAYLAWREVARPSARLLRRVATLVEENAEELAGIESRNLGKPISGARGEIGRSRTSSISTRTRRPLGNRARS